MMITLRFMGRCLLCVLVGLVALAIERAVLSRGNFALAGIATVLVCYAVIRFLRHLWREERADYRVDRYYRLHETRARFARRR